MQKVKEQMSTLSTSMKKVAGYLLEHPQLFAMQSATEIGKEVGVSETTVIRFCYSLNYSGFSELQKEVRESLIFAKSSLHTFQADKKEIGSGPRFYIETMQRDQRKIQKMMEQLNERDLHHTVNRLIESNHILVAGIRTSFAAAHWFSFTLNLIRGNTHLFQPGTDDMIHLLSKMNKQSTFVAFSFHRYAKETIKLAEAVKKQGAFVIAISDSASSPITEHADLHLPVQLSVKSTLDAAPAVFSLMNALIAGVSIHDSERFDQYRERYESLQLDDFFYKS